MPVDMSQYEEIVAGALQRVRNQGIEHADKFDQLIVVAAVGQAGVVQRLDDAKLALDTVTEIAAVAKRARMATLAVVWSLAGGLLAFIGQLAIARLWH